MACTAKRSGSSLRRCCALLGGILWGTMGSLCAQNVALVEDWSSVEEEVFAEYPSEEESDELAYVVSRRTGGVPRLELPKFITGECRCGRTPKHRACKVPTQPDSKVYEGGWEVEGERRLVKKSRRAQNGLEGVERQVEVMKEPLREIPEEFYKPYDPADYRISVGDVLEVSIFGHHDTWVTNIPVAPDGKVYYHFTGGVDAEGRTLDEVKKELEVKVKDLFTTPIVSIIPRSVTSAKFVILGKVKGPGEYPILSSMTIRQAIGEAGGFAEGGYRGTSIRVDSLENSFVIRDGQRLPIDFERLMNSEDVTDDIYIRPGDYIYIASALYDEVYRIGEVREQREIAFKDGLTLVGAVTGYSGVGGGYTEEANLNRVVVVRGALEDPTVLQFDLEAILEGRANDVYLAPGDIVYIPPKGKQALRELMKHAILTFARSFGGRAGYHYGLKWMD